LKNITITDEVVSMIVNCLKRYTEQDEAAKELVAMLERKAEIVRSFEIGERLVISNYEGRGNLAIKTGTLCDLVGFEEKDGLDMLKVNIHLPYEDANGLVWTLANSGNYFSLYVHPYEVRKLELDIVEER